MFSIYKYCKNVIGAQNMRILIYFTSHCLSIYQGVDASKKGSEEKTLYDYDVETGKYQMHILYNLFNSSFIVSYFFQSYSSI